ncbi:uncharacterized protein LOC115446289 isoform X2 [Manduca sexta]|uniref:Uncharacterized protein n=2 Tax=Manduca sexta TaxID=7130 RepID=A0A921ZB98_MANSE|nr:uncharacterized protein LOC115446289 isoform X2 [Manduca sexta]XP_030028753.1 uncharacterized protein LOC115446289 isoform X2 [Manduca sexta]KAG6454463.1 hypothetical protein O3G_MSEX008721 [Manduca sexta]
MVYNVIKYCCPGYYNVNAQEEASSTNCLKLCKMNCKSESCVNKQCVCPEGFIKDTTETVCIPNCGPGHKRVNGSCQPESKISSENNGANNKVDDTEPYTSNSDNSNKTLFFVSAVTNVILLLIVLVIVLTKCKTVVRDNKNNVTEPRDTYVDMNGASRNPVLFTKNESVPKNAMPGCSEDNVLRGGVHRHNVTEPPQYESIQYVRTTKKFGTDVGSTETLCYDYVETPLPIHLRKAKQQVPPRG